MVPRSGGLTHTTDKRSLLCFVMVALNLRTASPPEEGRSLRGHEREVCLLGDMSTLYTDPLLPTQLRGEMTWI